MADVFPAWLISSFTRTVVSLCPTAQRADIEKIANDLAKRWSTPERYFHNVNHLKDTLENVDSLAEQARDVDSIRLAAWFHGSVFDVSKAAVERDEGGINVEASADLARRELSSLGMSADKVEKIVRLIETLHRHKAGEDIDAQVLSDADLAVLGSDPEVYLDYLTAVRKEYQSYSDEFFAKTRCQIVESLLSRPQLFYTHAASAWEDQARENLRAELERLQKVGAKSASGKDTEPAFAQNATPETDDSLSHEGTEPRAEEQVDSPAQEETEDVNPFAPTDEADLGSTLENVEEVMDTLAMKAIKTDEIALKPMTEQD